MADPPIRVFYSYSRPDREMRDRLDEHLSHLRRSGKIVTWCDLQLEPGSEWEKTLLEKLETADVILLLVSARFLASDYCYDFELQRAIDRHKAGTAHVIPVILKPCDWNIPEVPFSKLQVLPTDAKPISSYRDEDEAYTIVAQGIRQVVEGLLEQRRKQQQAEIAALQAEAERQRQLEQQRRETERERSRLRYQQAFEQAMRSSFPNGEVAQYGLPLDETIRQQLRANSGLSDRDVEQIEGAIVAQKQAEQQELERQKAELERSRQQSEALKRQQALEQQRQAERLKPQQLTATPKLSQQKTTRTPRTASSVPWKRLPCGELTFFALGYIPIGSLLALASAHPYLWAMAVVVAVAVAWTVAVASAGALAWAVAWAMAVVVAVAWAMAVVVAVAWTWAWAMAVAWTVVMAWAGGLAVAVAEEKLLKSFSKMQVFLILAGVSLGGLGLGWLIGAIFD